MPANNFLLEFEKGPKTTETINNTTAPAPLNTEEAPTLAKKHEATDTDSAASDGADQVKPQAENTS